MFSHKIYTVFVTVTSVLIPLLIFATVLIVVATPENASGVFMVVGNLVVFYLLGMGLTAFGMWLRDTLMEFLE